MQLIWLANISSVMSLLGIQCSGNAKCGGDTKKKSTKEGSKSGLTAKHNDLDELLNALESGNHLPIDSCGDATTDPEPKTEINVWGPQVPLVQEVAQMEEEIQTVSRIHR